MANRMAHISLQVPEGINISDTDNADVLVADEDSETEGNTERQDVPDNTSTADEGDEQGSANPTNSDQTTNSGRPGIDDVLNHVRDNMGEHAEGVIRALMRDDTQVKQLDADRRRLREAIDEVEALRIGLEEEAEPDPMDEALAQVPDDQLQLLEGWMKKKGYVNKEDQNEEKKELMVVASNKAGIELFGEDFGKMDGDEFVVSEEAQESMAPVYERVVDNQNLDYRDLFILGNFEQLLTSARMSGRNEAIEEIREKNGQRVGRVQNGSVAVSNAGGSAKQQLYNPSEYRDAGGSKPGGFSRISDVLKKAALAAQSA